MTKFLSFLGRVLLAQIFLVAILFQLAIIFNSPSGYENYQVYLGHFGLPGVFAPLMILVQLLFGLSLLLGFKTKLSLMYSPFIPCLLPYSSSCLTLPQAAACWALCNTLPWQVVISLWHCMPLRPGAWITCARSKLLAAVCKKGGMTALFYCA